MKLIIDIGNSLVKIGVFQGKNLVETNHFDFLEIDNIIKFINKEKITHTIISSVKESKKEELELIKYYNALFFDSKIILPIKMMYNDISSLGNDRVAGAVGASFLYPKKDILVIDLGTCLTIDFISNKNVYMGGRISPGLNMRYNALHHFTDKLPLCKTTNKEYFIGNDTSSSIHSGIQQGMIAELDAVIDDFKQENKKNIVIATGGDCFFFEKALKNSIFADPFLVMKGLNEILDYNV